MRCARCGVEIEGGSVCDACAEGGSPERRSLLNDPVSNMTALLIVLGVIGFFVMMFGLTDRPEHAKKTKSLNDIKQLAIAVQTYAQDYHETFPGWIRNRDGRYAHNVWDEQVNPQIKAKDVFNNGDTGIRSYSQIGVTSADRVLTYGMNALLIATPTAFSGSVVSAIDTVGAANPPAPLTTSSVNNPAGTILFAELATTAVMPGALGQAPTVRPDGATATAGSSQWSSALNGWIDISPREFCEPTGQCTGSNAYDGTYSGYQENGIARTLYGGGGVYAFCDGHAQFMKIAKTVGIGTTVEGTFVTAENCWEPWNTNNMWNPR